MNHDDELEQRCTAEIIALEESGAGMPFVFKPSEAFMLLAALQLTLRHPNLALVSPLVTFARELAGNIENRLSKGGPAIAEVARRGWNPDYDVMPERLKRS